MNILDLMPICYMNPYVAGLSGGLAEMIIDMMEYATDGAAQAAWVTNGAPADKNGTHAITANGNAAYSTAQKSSYNSSTKSVYFDGTGDYLSVLDHTDWNFGSGNFTIDAFVYFTSVSTGGWQTIVYQEQTYPSLYQAFTYNDSLDILRLQYNDTVIVSKSWNPSINTWYHVAGVRNGTTWTLYVDGTSIGSETASLTLNDYNAILKIGTGFTRFFNGYIDNIRITKGTALWTSNFTISDAGLLYTGSPNFGNLFIGENTSLDSLSESTIKTQGTYALKLAATTGALNQTVTKTLTGGDILDLTGKNTIKFDARSTATGGNLELNIANDVTLGSYEQKGNLLIDGQGTINDENGTHTITAEGDAAVSTAQYCPYGKSSSSIYFDGTGDYLTVPDHADWDWGSNSFTIDLFVYPASISENRIVTTTRPNASGYSSFMIFLAGTGDYLLYMSSNGSSWDICAGAVIGTADLNTWTHLKVSRTGNGNIRKAKNGVHSDDVVSSAAIVAVSNVLLIGADANPSTYFVGYIDNYRITKGTNLFPADFNLNDAELFYANKETHTITISSADTYQEESWDISGVADADKNAIDQLQLKVIGAVSNASFVNEACSSLGSWADGDGGTGASTQVTFDTQETFKFDTGATAGVGNHAKREQDFGSIESLGNRIVIGFKIYCDALGTLSNLDSFALNIFRSDWNFSVTFSSDGLFISDGTTNNEVGTNLVVQDTWQDWTFDIDLSAGVASAVCDVYLDGVLQASSVDCSWTSVETDGRVYMIIYAYNTANRITYVDYLKIGSAFQFTGSHYIDNVRSE